MATSRSARRDSKAKSKSKTPKPQAEWSQLTWDDLANWAGGSTLTRGRSYQRSRRVKKLAISQDGVLLATVQGTERYTTTVALKAGQKQPSLESLCTCPVGFACKHAVAVVTEYLQALADGTDVPTASEHDLRWKALENRGEYDEEDWEDDSDVWGDDEEDWGEEPEFQPRRTRSGQGKAAGARASFRVDWNAKIESHIRAKPQGELADLVWSLVLRYPDLHQEFRERIALQEGDVDQLVAEARREIREVTSIAVWRNRWDGTGEIADYSKIRHRLERLLELGHADQVVALGRDLVRKGLQQVNAANDEGETSMELASCLAVVLQAVEQSSLSGPERLLFVIDAELADDFDVIRAASDVVFNANVPPEDWSTVADTLLQRLELEPAPARRATSTDAFQPDYQRDRLTRWIATALEHSGREAELRPLYEAEALANGSYVRLVKYLIDNRKLDDAAQWARRGIAATTERWPGIASQLTATLREIAHQRKQWDVVAAHVALAFFNDYPRLSTFEELMKAARKARVEAPVRAAALRFLETGVRPYEIVSPKASARIAHGLSRTPARGRRAAKSAAASGTTPETPPIIVEIDPDWPLPVLDELVPLLERPGRYGTERRPHLDVLLEMAIADKQPDQVLHWFDKMRSSVRNSPYGNHSYGDLSYGYADRVAAAVAETHPERALEIYQAALDAQLPHAQISAYESAASYLRKLRPIYEAVGRASEWTDLLASIRERYRTRPRFMEILDGIDGRTIVQSSRSRRK